MSIGRTTFRNLTCCAAFILAFSASPATLAAQDTWSLQRSIEYARQNSLALQQAGFSIELAKLSDKQNHRSRLPNLGASSSGGVQFGRTIDPTTNSFDNQTIAYNSFGVNSAVTLFSGGRINHAIKQGKMDVQAAEKDAAAALNDIALNIATAHLSILLSEEQLENAVKRRSLTQDQLAQTDKLIAAGSLPANDRLDVLALLANDEQSIVQAQNSIDLNYLTLKELMQLDPATEIKIERPAFNLPAGADAVAMDLVTVYGQAVANQPQVAASELRVQSALVGVDLAKSGYYPTLTLFAGLSTSWSGASKLLETEDGIVRVNNIIYVNTNDLGLGLGELPVTVGQDVPFTNFNRIDYPYFDQLQDNFGQNIGASLNIPIYSNSLNNINVQRAQVGILRAKVESELVKQQLKNDIQQALAGARAARLTLEASQLADDAARMAFENAEKRFSLGTINNLELLTARNNFDIAQTNLIVAKYDYLFRLKILDFYLGKEIRLD